MSKNRIEYMVDKNGNEFWMDPDTFKDHPLPSSNIFSITHGETLEMHYPFSYNKERDSIDIRCHIKSHNINGPAYHIPAKNFMEVLYEAYVKEETFSRKDEVIEYKKQAESLLINSKLQEGIVFNKAFVELNGVAYGVVMYEEDVVGVFDTFEINKELSGYSIGTDSLYTDIKIAKDKHPQVLIYFENGTVYDIPELTSVTLAGDGTLKEYSFKFNNIYTSNSLDNKFVKLIEPLPSNDPDWIDQRKNLLASDELGSSIEDRFDDIFDF